MLHLEMHLMGRMVNTDPWRSDRGRTHIYMILIALLFVIKFLSVYFNLSIFYSFNKLKKQILNIQFLIQQSLFCFVFQIIKAKPQSDMNRAQKNITRHR